MTGAGLQAAAVLGAAATAAAAGQLPQFYDARDLAVIPSGRDVMLPVDGEFSARGADLRRFGRVRWYTVTGDGRNAGAIDWEPLNPCFTASGLRGFVRERRAIGARARVYVQRSLAAEAVRALADFGRGELLAYPRLLWWIPTLDNHEWTADALAANLADVWGAEIPAGQLWANQFATIRGNAGRPVDVSNLFGEW